MLGPRMSSHHIQVMKFPSIKNQSTFSFIWVFPFHPLHICTISLTSINLRLALPQIFLYSGWNQTPSLLPATAWEALITPLSYCPPHPSWGGRPQQQRPKLCFSYCFHMTPLKTHTPTHTHYHHHRPPQPLNNSHAWMLESNLKAGAPSRSSVSPGSRPGNWGSTDKRGGERERWERESRREKM